MPISQAKVKSVPSGDTLLLSAVNNPNQERTLSLAFVSAPRLRREGDEPFAYQSREFLRSMAVGKVIQFNVLYSVPTPTKRDYGTFMLQSGESFPEASIAEGWAKLRNDAGRKDESQESKDLLSTLELEEQKAKAGLKGVWATTGGKIENSYEIPDPKSFVEQWKGKQLPAIVERVLTGDRIIARLETSTIKHVQTMILIAGIRAPATKRAATVDNKEQPAEPFGSEAHQFVETRLLHRKVDIEVLGISPQNQLVCTINHPNGSIAKFILAAGLARCTDHHSTMLGGQMSALRAAEREAKDKRLGIFQGTASTKSGGSEMDATITRIQTADMVYMRGGKSGEEKRVSLSSIRQPKPSDPQQAPFQADAKEFLRKKLIGKHVRVTIDGHKAANEGFEERDVVTVMVNSKNVALQLVEAGYASVIRHKRDDEDRSPYYDELLAAEETAKTEGNGMWSSKPPPAKNLQDYSETLQKAKIQSSVLQRQKKIPAIVDFVRGGSRFSIIIPRENAKLTFVLSGIRAPRSSRNPNEKSEPFGQEAHDFATRRCMQREVEIDVEGIDKIGGFIGSLYINRENFAKLLLEEGLATVHAYSAEQSGNATELFAAEGKAKEAKKGIWHDYDPSINDGMEDLALEGNDTNGTADSDAAPRQKDYRDVTVSFIDPTTAHLKIQIIGNATSGALTSLMSAFAAFHRSPPSSEKSLPNPPKTNELVAARFSEDGAWYRARIRRNDREAKKADILFIDYGNSETLPWSELRPMTQPQFSVQKLKPQAIDAGLSFLQFPSGADYLSEACRFVEEITAGKELVAIVDFEEKDGTLWVTLLDPGNEGGEEASINAELVSEGMAMVNRKLRGWEKAKGKVIEDLNARQKKAVEEHLGMWEYGDPTED